MTRGCSESAVVVLAGEHEINGLGSGKGLWMTHEMEGGQPPIEAIKAKVLSKPVLVLIFLCVEALNVLDMGCRG